MIDLPSGGQFDEHDLVAHITASGRDYIIQGQQNASLATHGKPHSLDYWLRQFGPNSDTRQAENNILHALVGTGMFVIVDDLSCPDSGEQCKGIRLTLRAQASIAPRMLEIHVTTTDLAFVSDLNAANIEGVRADYRPTLAFDSAGHIFQIVVAVASQVGGRLLGAWLADRLKKAPTPPSITINSHTTINAQNVVQIIQQSVEQPSTRNNP